MWRNRVRSHGRYERLEPCAAKVACTVLRGGDGGNTIPLTRPFRRGRKFGTILVNLFLLVFVKRQFFFPIWLSGVPRHVSVLNRSGTPLGKATVLSVFSARFKVHVPLFARMSENAP
jgi:hypothetical protein